MSTKPDQAHDETERRVERLTDQLRQLTPTWRWAPVVNALQALRGVSFVTAVGLTVEVGDIRRFDHPQEFAWSRGGTLPPVAFAFASLGHPSDLEPETSQPCDW